MTSAPPDEPATSEPDEQVQLVDSIVDDGVLTVDFSAIEETRSMVSRISDASGERVGLFVTRNDEGAMGRLVVPEPGEEISVFDGELSGEQDSFDLEGLEPGEYRSCVRLVQTDGTVCTDFVL